MGAQVSTKPKPKPQPQPQPRPRPSPSYSSFYTTSSKCRAKYGYKYPLAFGDEKLNPKGCFTCPDGYTLRHPAVLDPRSEMRCVKVEYKPAISQHTGSQGYKLNCGHYHNKNDRVINDNSDPRSAGVNPWHSVLGNACMVAKNENTDYKVAKYIGKL